MGWNKNRISLGTHEPGEFFKMRSKPVPKTKPPAALGVAEWTPYRDGGGYRLNPDGSILISFSVLRGLKGHSLVQRPVASADGKKITWQCSADAEFARGFLPAGCR